jgi:hypothetical protein
MAAHVTAVGTYAVLLYLKLYLLFFKVTSVDTEMCCPKGKCGCQYFILLVKWDLF